MAIFSKALLRTLGLTDAQAAVYIAALELGSATMQDLAWKSGVKRTSIYNFLDELKEAGLLIEAKKKKRRVYSAVPPDQLVEAQKLRTEELERALPELRALHNVSRKKPHVTFYEGAENVLAVYDDQLKERQPIVAYEDLEYMKRGMSERFYAVWPAERAKRNIAFKSILRDSPAAREYTKKNIRLLRQSKIVRAEPWKTEVNIYGNKVAFMRFGERTPMCVVIEDADIAATMRASWQMLWEKLDVSVVG